jgi:diadenosine tetraphosphate (Ap4A) HIT family hydrolase
MGVADVRNCTCDLASAESMAKRECGLCREAEKKPADTRVFFLKDINPNKPHRWLALPRAHAHTLADLTPADRQALWTAAIQKAQEVWGDQWGIAANGEIRRTQCHVHVHIGKLLEGFETGNFVVAGGPADIPAPTNGAGLWIHPVAGKLHVHVGEDAPELVLMR